MCDISPVAFAVEDFEQPIVLECRSGLINELKSFGVTTKTEDQTICLHPTSSSTCDSALNNKELQDFFTSSCQN